MCGERVETEAKATPTPLTLDGVENVGVRDENMRHKISSVTRVFLRAQNIRHKNLRVRRVSLQTPKYMGENPRVERVILEPKICGGFSCWFEGSFQTLLFHFHLAYVTLTLIINSLFDRQNEVCDEYSGTVDCKPKCGNRSNVPEVQ